MLVVKRLVRQFQVNGKSLKDPNPEWSIEEVKKHFAMEYPDILNCDIGQPEIGNEILTYSFTKTVATKG